MKTRVEIPNAMFRRVKLLAIARGVTLKQIFREALEDKLRQPLDLTARCVPSWKKGFGGLADLRSENARIMKLIDQEFETIEPEDRA